MDVEVSSKMLVNTVAYKPVARQRSRTKQMYNSRYFIMAATDTRAQYVCNTWGARGILVVKALGYKPEGRGFETPIR
jgi:hypothetical protein